MQILLKKALTDKRSRNAAALEKLALSDAPLAPWGGL